MRRHRKLELETVLAIILILVMLPLWTGAAMLVAHEDAMRGSMATGDVVDPGGAK